jgi:uncharacterized lipoprotein YddW (UPF0748 family)
VEGVGFWVLGWVSGRDEDDEDEDEDEAEGKGFGGNVAGSGYVRRMKLFRFSTGTLLAAVMAVLALVSARGADTEFRGVWVATVYNIDWPSKAGLAASEQKEQLRALLDRAAELKLNAILLQVRPASDALYASKLEPWSRFLTGQQGSSPGYDPLEYAVAEAHKRGLELHAWVNPFRASASANDALVESHVAKRHPEWVRRYGSQLWLDPGEPAAREHVLRVFADIVSRYDVDGLHIDDYFYPYPKGGAVFPDDKTFEKYGGGKERGEWRRDNINRFVETMYRSIKVIKPRVKVGISPFGIWRPGVPPTIEAGVDSYGHLFADSRKWLAEGWCDYLAPQLYWSIDPPAQSFPVLLKWWREQSRGKPVWPGIASTRIGKGRPAQEIVNQIALTRKGSNAPGHIHWSMKSLMRNQGGIADLLKSGPNAEKAGKP